jgi:hypothetical protein
MREGVELTDDFLCSIAPHCVEVFGSEVGIMLARSLLWAAYEVEVRMNDQVVSLIPSDLGAKIKAAYAGGGNVNPIEKIGLLVTQRMDQLDIVHVSKKVGGNNNDGGSGGAGGGGGSAAGGGEGGQDFTDNVCSQQIFHLQQIVGDMRNEVNSLFSDQRRHINTLNANVKRIALVPGLRGGAAERARTANEDRRVALSKCPRDLWVLWREWEQGLGEGKPAKAFTHAERGANKFSFSRRKVFWDMVEDMVKRGNTSDVAIDRIYRVYGWNNSVTKILNEMRQDKRRGVRRV